MHFYVNQLQGSKLNMSVSRKAQHGLFYQLSMSIDYTLEDNSCGTENIPLMQVLQEYGYIHLYQWKVHNGVDLDIFVISFISSSLEATF
jgi:hypothetical protein